jgi:CBS domain-containing protein
MKIDDIMTPLSRRKLSKVEASLFVDHDDILEEALDLMVQNSVTTLPVLGPEGDLVGNVSYFDVLRALREAGQGDVEMAA